MYRVFMTKKWKIWPRRWTIRLKRRLGFYRRNTKTRVHLIGNYTCTCNNNQITSKWFPHCSSVASLIVLFTSLSVHTVFYLKLWTSELTFTPLVTCKHTNRCILIAHWQQGWVDHCRSGVSVNWTITTSLNCQCATLPVRHRNS